METEWRTKALKCIIIILAVILTACGGSATIGEQPKPNPDQSTIPTPQPVPPGQNGTYANGYALPAVTAIYSITVDVLAAPGSVSQYSFQGSQSGSTYNGYGHMTGYISGGTSGKGLIRAKIVTFSWDDPYKDIMHQGEQWTPLVKVGDTVLLKTEDSKAAALGEGDRVTFLCREDQEFVAPAAINEIPTTKSVTRELDNCRMLSPQITSKK